MGGALLSSGSPASSDGGSVAGSGGGAPLYGWSPGKRGARLQGEVDSSPETVSPTTSETGNSSGNRLTTERGFPAEKDPRTPSDQEIRTPEPFKPHRSFSKSTLRAATRALLNPTTTSVGVIPPVLTLSAYPGPGAPLQRQPSLPIIVPVSVPVAGSIPGSQVQGHPSLPGSTTHSFISAMQAMNLNAAEENLHPTQKTHRDEICKLQARIWGLRQGMYRQTSIPQEFLTSFDYDVQELMSNTVKMNQVVDDLAAELKKAISEHDRIRGLEATIRDLEGDLSDYKERAQIAEKTLGSLASRSDEDMRTIQFLKEQLRQNEMARMILQEQVNGKRNLWLNVHTDPQERAVVLDSLARSSTPLSGQTLMQPVDQVYGQGARGPGSVRSSTSHSTSVHSGVDHSNGTPPGNVNPGRFHHGGGPYIGGPHVGGYSPFQFIPHSYSGPAAYMGQHQRRGSNATASSAGYAASRNSGGGGGPSRPSSSGPRRIPRVSTITETGSPKERKRSGPRSLVRADLDDAECLAWADEFQSLFALIYGFCASYFHELPSLDKGWKSHIQAEANGDLWEYICRICQTPQEQEPGEHALRLLKDRDSRPYLMQRLLLQHIMVFIFGHQGWKDYSEDIDDEMEKLEGDLKTVDPSKTYERQVLIDRRAQLVKEMTSGPNAAAFRNFKLTQHHQYLKTMVAPFLARRKGSNVTNEAFYDLFAITTTAWDLSAKLFGSRLSFQYVWNDPGARFAAGSHEPLDCAVDRLTLQHEHCRVVLCATPAVTVRNDQGMTIDAKNILKSGVLLMRY